MTAGNYSTPHWDEHYQPGNRETLRRYRSFDYFESILRNEQLWFTRADQFPDNFEGTLTKLNKMYIDAFGDLEGLEGVGDLSESLIKRARRARFQTYANCWRIASKEYPLIWQAYLQGDSGVAIETTVGDLLEEVAEKRQYHIHGDPEPLTIRNDRLNIRWGRIRYIDYLNQWMPNPEIDALEPLFHKRDAFWQEQEFRVLVPDDVSNLLDLNPEGAKLYDLDELNDNNPENIHCSVDTDNLINRIIIAPHTSDDFHDKVEKTAANYLTDPNVVQSGLDQDEPFI